MCQNLFNTSVIGQSSNKSVWNHQKRTNASFQTIKIIYVFDNLLQQLPVLEPSMQSRQIQTIETNRGNRDESSSFQTRNALVCPGTIETSHVSAAASGNLHTTTRCFVLQFVVVDLLGAESACRDGSCLILLARKARAVIAHAFTLA